VVCGCSAFVAEGSVACCEVSYLLYCFVLCVVLDLDLDEVYSMGGMAGVRV
jgi:hypothetical protein